MTLVDIDATANAVTGVVGAIMLVLWPSWALLGTWPRRTLSRRPARHVARRGLTWAAPKHR